MVVVDDTKWKPFVRTPITWTRTLFESKTRYVRYSSTDGCVHVLPPIRDRQWFGLLPFRPILIDLLQFFR